jgi:MFS family permease
MIYLGVRLVTEATTLAQSVAISWTIYRLSDSPLSLGLVGLVQLVPMMVLTLPAGEYCDRSEPRRIFAAGLAMQAICAAAFFGLTSLPVTGLWTFYAVLLLFGGARAFVDPASQSLLPFLVAPERLPQAIAWSSSLWQAAVISGPVLGGLAYALGPRAAYALCCAGFLLAMLGVWTVGGRRVVRPAFTGVRERIARIGEGLRFVRSHSIVLGAISLDLFAVLLGGSTALLPVYARDILHVGPIGLGLLRSAPAVGACLIALHQTRYPPNKRVGLKLFAAVAIFGVATLIFAFSTSFAISLAALVVLGASDMMSVNIRSSLVQLVTPDTVRGRVSAVNMLFIGVSSELGAFESGVAASLLGTVPAVALGGVATLVVVAVWMKFFPALRTADHLTPAKPSHPP